jgi:hypothetical protein
MLPLALDGTLPACLTVHSHVHSQDSLKLAMEHTLKFTPVALDGTLAASFTICSLLCSQDAAKYTLSTPGSAFPGILSRTLLIATDGTLPPYVNGRS